MPFMVAIAALLLLAAADSPPATGIPSLDQFTAVAQVGAGALLAIAVFALYTRRIRTRGEAEEDKAEGDARLAEMRVDRDAWKALAQSSDAHLARLVIALEAVIGKKLAE